MPMTQDRCCVTRWDHSLHHPKPLLPGTYNPTAHPDQRIDLRDVLTLFRAVTLLGNEPDDIAISYYLTTPDSSALPDLAFPRI
jgi:hypothetical protein